MAQESSPITTHPEQRGVVPRRRAGPSRLGEVAAAPTIRSSPARPRVSVPSLRLPGAVRRTLGMAGLVVVYVALWLMVWAIAPALGLGWTSVVITSGSMAPAIRPGDVVVAEPHHGRALGPGTVAVFRDPSGDGLVTHRISGVNPDGSYLTRGDANRAADSTPLRPEQVVGVGRILVPVAGLPVVWYLAGAWDKLAAGAVLVLLCLWTARFAFEKEPIHVPA